MIRTDWCSYETASAVGIGHGQKPFSLLPVHIRNQQSCLEENLSETNHYLLFRPTDASFVEEVLENVKIMGRETPRICLPDKQCKRRRQRFT